ncbi:MAG: S41 family peptidase [Cyclobacteriaceae bacterium]|nr:S41 family peptidase [Cyclobacteriaceae bacterium]
MKKTFRFLLSTALVVVLGSLASCKKDEVKPSEFDYVNSWIQTNMKEAYYWTDRIPASPNKALSPDKFFESLLTKPDDRFSWIQDNYQELLSSLQGVTKEAGYEFALYRANLTNNNVLAQILYIKKGSPAEVAGLNRGDVIDQINNTQITSDNYLTLLQAIGEPHSITYRPYDFLKNEVGAPKTISLTTLEYAENPNFLDKVITVNNRKIGYYVYNLFSTGPTAESKQYNEEMDAVFTRFKAAGITDLVLDLRFNSGGAETATVNLASLIGKGVDATKIFAKKQYNSTVTSQILNDPKYGPEFLKTKFTNKTQNVGSMLRNNRVYILTGSRSASASELLINGLRPFMDVFLIGAKTVGKNVGSVTIYEPNDPKNNWGMQPIVVKSFNSLDQSDYGNGFSPNVEDKDNGAQLPLGDPNEALLSRAIQHISSSGRVASREKNLGVSLGHSFDFKKRNSDLIIENNPF